MIAIVLLQWISHLYEQPYCPVIVNRNTIFKAEINITYSFINRINKLKYGNYSCSCKWRNVTVF